MSKNIQIPEQLFFQLFKYHILDMKDQELQELIVKGLNDKFEALVKRDLYTKSKVAETPEEREKARQDYLDRIGVPQQYRW